MRQAVLIVDVNPYLIEMLGYSKDQFLKKNIWDINAFRNIDYSKRLFKELQEKKYVRYTDLPLEAIDGTLIYVEFVSNVYLVDGEKVIQCNIRDITDRRKYEKFLTNNIHEKASMLKELQHRTKNSFSLITSLISLRSDSAASDETKTSLEELSLRVRAISDLYSLLYDSGSFDNVLLNTYCGKVIESTIKLSEKITISKNIEEITLPAREAATVGMILVEILSNSIKYAFPGNKQGTIKIDLKKAGTNIFLSISDDGIGMPKDFDIDNAKTLGLHLVKLMVSQLLGNIKFETGNGTKIIIDFPA